MPGTFYEFYVQFGITVLTDGRFLMFHVIFSLKLSFQEFPWYAEGPEQSDSW